VEDVTGTYWTGKYVSPRVILNFKRKISASRNRTPGIQPQPVVSHSVDIIFKKSRTETPN
jgi:hypothetical protein